FYVGLDGIPGVKDRTSTKLHHLARRWPRLAITGLPGSGKTTAIEQLAAAWASNRAAPLPVLVRMSKLVHDLSDHTLPSLEAVVRHGEYVPPDVAPHIVDMLHQGK